MKPDIILASGSASRRALLEGAGIEAEIQLAQIDEETAKQSFRASQMPVCDQAMQLAEMKAMKVSCERSGLVIGADQMLALNGRAFDKPADLQAARTHLEALSGQTHRLETAIVICEAGQPVWRHLARPRLSVRDLSSDFISAYIGACGEDLLSTVGAYKLEGMGAQLFSKIEGDYFSILGLPLLPLLAYLRTRGVLIS